MANSCMMFRRVLWLTRCSCCCASVRVWVCMHSLKVKLYVIVQHAICWSDFNWPWHIEDDTRADSIIHSYFLSINFEEMLQKHTQSRHIHTFQFLYADTQSHTHTRTTDFSVSRSFWYTFMANTCTHTGTHVWHTIFHMILNKIEVEQARDSYMGMHMVRYMPLPQTRSQTHTLRHKKRDTHTIKWAPAKLNIQRTYQIERDNVYVQTRTHTSIETERVFETVCGTPITKMTFTALSIDRNWNGIDLISAYLNQRYYIIHFRQCLVRYSFFDFFG